MVKKYLKKILTTSPTIFLRKAVKKIIVPYNRYCDLRKDTRNNRDVPIIQNSYLDIFNLDVSKIDIEIADYLSNMYLAHRFNLLGSGWVKNTYSSDALGVEGFTYQMNVVIEKFDAEGDWLNKILLPKDLISAKKIWQNISKDYVPIDWQKDFKSGYRWSTKCWFKDQSIGEHLGADIKVPFELARFQHLPQMALFANILPEKRKELIIEFRNQILDFISTNPPAMGCNWTCTMDVGIRAANMLVAFDLFSKIDNDKILDNTFNQLFSNSVYEHGKHIVNNLEWYTGLTTNHYLANISGLLFIAAYLESNEEIDAWLGFAIQELIVEFQKQFHKDGTNFEASTSYHRLSTEFIIYSTTLILGFRGDKKEALRNYNHKKWKKVPLLKPADKQDFKLDSFDFFPDWYWKRLFKSGKFAFDITKPNDEIPQIGDNDNGRFFIFSPIGKKITNKEADTKYINLKGYEALEYVNADAFYWDENVLNHQTLIAALSGIIPAEYFEKASLKFPLEKSIVASFSNDAKVGINFIQNEPEVSLSIKNNSYDLSKFYTKQNSVFFDKKYSHTVNPNVNYIVYPDFGVYLFKSEGLYLIISGGNNGQNGYGGHAHNDKLSFELNVGGTDIIVDPGTYLYTPLPEKRNKFRSTKAHHGILAKNIEQNQWDAGQSGLFGMKNESNCFLLEISNNSIQLGVFYKNIVHIRKFDIYKDKILINDYVNSEFEVNINKFEYYSKGYGSYCKINNVIS